MRLPVFLSASEPYRTSELKPDVLRDPAYADSANLINIRAALRAFCAHVLPNFPLVFGGHPAVTPLVRGMRQALLREQALYLEQGEALDLPPPVLIYQSAYFPGVIAASDPSKPMVLVTPPSEAGGGISARDNSLMLLRYEMLGVPEAPGYAERFAQLGKQFGRSRLKYLDTARFSAGVFIGGMEGVLSEFDLFRTFHPETPAYALASTGAAARTLGEEMRHQSPALRARLLEDTAYGVLMQRLLPVTGDVPADLRWRVPPQRERDP